MNVSVLGDYHDIMSDTVNNYITTEKVADADLAWFVNQNKKLWIPEYIRKLVRPV